MSTRKILKDGVACGCESAAKGERETMSKMCAAHQKEFDVHHAAAVESCSHVYRDRNLDLVA
jgi:hypothetical protein